MKPVSTVQSVERAFDIIEYLLAVRTPASTNEIAKGVGLHINTTGNLVRTLYHRGYLTQDTPGKWVLGPQCIAMSGADNFLVHLRQVALPILEQIANETGDNAFLGVNQNNQLYCVAQINGSGAVVVSGEQAWLEQIHSTAAGQVLLAWDDERSFFKLKEKGALRKFAQSTIVSFTKLKAKLDEIHTRGYSLCVEESCNGIASIAVPVLSQSNRLIAALGQAFPSFYLKTKQIVVEERVSLLAEMAGKIQALSECR